MKLKNVACVISVEKFIFAIIFDFILLNYEPSNFFGANGSYAAG